MTKSLAFVLFLCLSTWAMPENQVSSYSNYEPQEAPYYAPQPYQQGSSYSPYQLLKSFDFDLSTVLQGVFDVIFVSLGVILVFYLIELGGKLLGLKLPLLKMKWDSITTDSRHITDGLKMLSKAIDKWQ